MGPEGSDRDSMLEKDFFISRIMVGDCPRCGSINTHDCGASDFDPLTIDSPENVFEKGSECWAVGELDDPTIGHCDDCDYLWCIECGSQISVDERVCGHWAICDECSSENGYMTLDEILEKVCPKCEHWDDVCLLDDPLLCDEVWEYKCPYEIDISECPTIRKWKNARTANP